MHVLGKPEIVKINFLIHIRFTLRQKYIGSKASEEKNNKKLRLN